MNVKVYACGGTGINISKQLRLENVDVTYVDTSKSNLRGAQDGKIFLVDDMDGAGKMRTNAYEGFKDIANDVLLAHKPSKNLNVVISSLAGGSGSVMAPLVTRELLTLGLPVLVVGVDSQQSIKELTNTIDTLMSYKGIADKVNLPVSMMYVENTSRAEADKKVQNFLSLLSLIANKELTDEFDSADLKSFLQFHRVTDNEPTLSMVEVVPNDTASVTKGTSVAGTILVTRDKQSNLVGCLPDYLTTCVVTDPDYKVADIRINNVLGKLHLIIEGLNGVKTNVSNVKQVNRIKDVDVKSANLDGMVI